MSSEGLAVVAVPLAPVALAAMAAAGLVVLGAQGIMWCGKKMDENYAQACKAWEAQYMAARAANRTNVAEIPTLLAGQLERMAAARASLELEPETSVAATTSLPNIRTQTLMNTITQLRTMVENGQDTAALKATSEHELLVYRLKSEIAAGRGMLPVDVIRFAETALHGSTREIQKALGVLQRAWETASSYAQNTYRERHVRQLLGEVKAQLSSIDSMLDSARRPKSAYLAPLQSIERQIADAYAVVEAQPEQALALAVEAQRASRELAHLVSSDLFNGWEETRKQLLSAQGVLDVLGKMVQEARALNLIDAQQASEMSRSLAVLQSEVRTVAQGSASPGQKRLLLLNERVDLLKEDVFRLTKNGQQRQIAQTITTTLAELGYHSYDGTEPLVRENGTTMRIEVMRTGASSSVQRDDKVVAFDVTRQGDVGYDFSGYVGDSCLTDAKEIFAALRAKGIYLLDKDQVDTLPPRVSIGTINQERFTAQLRPNKAQAMIAERLQAVLAQMQYTTIKQSVIGGCIEIEALNGQIGYRVMLPPDGLAQVFRNNKDISEEQTDPLVAETVQTLEEETEPSVIVEEEPSRRTQRATRKRQILGQ